MTSPSQNKKRIMEEARTKVLSTIELMKNSEESKFLLENDSEFRNQYEILRATKAKVEEKSLGVGSEKNKNVAELFCSGPVKEPEDPRCFSIHCVINGTPIPECIMDLGASRSIMPLRLAKLAGITDIKRTNTMLVLANWTTRKLDGIAENVIVSIRRAKFLTKFMILDTTNDMSSRVILGRPFLVASKAKYWQTKGR